MRKKVKSTSILITRQSLNWYCRAYENILNGRKMTMQTQGKKGQGREGEKNENSDVLYLTFWGANFPATTICLRVQRLCSLICALLMVLFEPPSPLPYV